MIYPSVLSAVVSALAAEAIDNTSKQAWQKLYRPGYADSGSLESLIRTAGEVIITRMDADCWVYARLHSQLIPRHWDALVAKYSTHKGKKVQAIAALAPLIASPAPRLFVQKAVTAWAIPPLKGGEGKRSTDMIVLPAQFYDMNGWDLEANHERTRRRWRKAVSDVLEEMVGEALQEVERILKEEGVLLNMAA
ncbi:hypothetical protein [Stutzerimonas stutzeri]|uniref:hypothetical protein n=1 Tax=Stutzerimonas stutzeri TaxID=316 RepID=UPI00265AD7C3|nr:hypothetical protein [Stutzerimonas stutzeri]MCF6780902.1 hypothetical protein [Stutzerimonas stutzeri]MCF6803471.1 hypothetical protein [Stutzerimonas stutzeri]